MRQARRKVGIERVEVETEKREDRRRVGGGQVAHDGVDAREGGTDAGVVRTHVDRHLARGGREADGLVCGDESALGESDGRRDGRVTAERHLGDGGEVPHGDGPIARRARDESRLGIVDVDRDLLHLGIGQRRRVEHDAGRVSAAGLGGEGGVAEDVGAVMPSAYGGSSGVRAVHFATAGMPGREVPAETSTRRFLAIASSRRPQRGGLRRRIEGTP